MPALPKLIAALSGCACLLALIGLAVFWGYDSPSSQPPPTPSHNDTKEPSDDKTFAVDTFRQLREDFDNVDVAPFMDGARTFVRNHIETAEDAATISPARYLSADQRAELSAMTPEHWGEFVPGVHRRLHTDEPAVALTLDACDAGFDEAMIEMLKDWEVPATIFVSGWWIGANRHQLVELAEHPLFEIANHGLRHRPCSVTGREIMGIEGTTSVDEAAHEIEANAQRIEELTGQRPLHYRSGTAHYDEVCVQIANLLDHHVIGYDVVGDQGASLDAPQVKEALSEVSAGSIVILHVNKPGGESKKGLKKALPNLMESGLEFVQLSDVDFSSPASD